jgi:hypothetical protein
MRISLPLMLVPLLVAALAGCMGSDGPSTTGGQTTQPTGPTDTGKPEENETPEPPKGDFAYHTHDNWGTDTRLVFYDGDMELARDASKEMRFVNNRLIIGTKTFTPEDDGDDDGIQGKSDIMLQGTKEVEVTITWTSQSNIPGLMFAFKHAATADFIEVSTPVTNGQKFIIPLQAHWADMPHRDSVSRWAFRVDAYDPAQSSAPTGASIARGLIHVKMEIVKGDASMIDPPHPFFFTHGPVRYGGEINMTILTTVTVDQQGQQLAYGSNLEGRKPQAPHIVPWEATMVRVWLYYNYTGAASPVEHKLGLKFHGADTPTYSKPTAVSTVGNSAYYEIPVTSKMSDSPYAFETDWAYGVYPIVAGQAGQGDFEGNVHIYIQTVKE